MPLSLEAMENVKFCFSISVADQSEPIVLRAASEEILGKWMRVINSAPSIIFDSYDGVIPPTSKHPHSPPPYFSQFFSCRKIANELASSWTQEKHSAFPIVIFSTFFLILRYIEPGLSVENFASLEGEGFSPRNSLKRFLPGKNSTKEKSLTNLFSSSSPSSPTAAKLEPVCVSPSLPALPL